MPGSRSRCRRSAGNNCPRFSNVARRLAEASAARASSERSRSIKVIMLARLAAKASEFASIWDVTATISVLQSWAGRLTGVSNRICRIALSLGIVAQTRYPPTTERVVQHKVERG